MHIYEANEFIKNYKDPKAKKPSTKLTESKKSLNEEDKKLSYVLKKYFYSNASYKKSADGKYYLFFNKEDTGNELAERVPVNVFDKSLDELDKYFNNSSAASNQLVKKYHDELNESEKRMNEGVMIKLPTGEFIRMTDKQYDWADRIIYCLDLGDDEDAMTEIQKDFAEGKASKYLDKLDNKASKRTIDAFKSFLGHESKKRMNESASMDMFRSCAEDIYDSEIRKLNTTITVTGRYSGEVWDDGTPVLKYFDRGQTKKLRQTFNPGEVFISGRTRSGKIEAWFSVGGGWLLVDQNQLAFCCDVCNENDFDDISEILE